MIITMVCSSWSYRHREVKQPNAGLSVDVFLPVYREPVEMIRQTVRAAKRMSYPHETYLLDDGKRDEIKALAEELGVKYVRRPTNQGAKAGNMNYALEQSTGDCIFVFDADHIAQIQAIDFVIGFFDDTEVGMVITPQDYYNLDGLQFLHHGRGRIWHDQCRFFNITQGCKDSNNCATSIGTGVMYRRKALDQIGGFPELTITEDMHVSLLMHAHQWRSVYFNEPIAYGIAPADLADYYRTRERWAHGNLHVLKEEKPWADSRLSWKQRFSYMELGIIYLECWQQLLMFLVPVFSLIFAWQPFEITSLNVFIVLIFPIFVILLLDEQACGMNRNWCSQLFAIARMPVQITGWAAVFGRRLKWRVSKKNLHGEFQFSLVIPQVCLTLLSIVALIFGISNIPNIEHSGPVTHMFQSVWDAMSGGTPNTVFSGGESIQEVLLPGYSWDLLLISSFWILYNGSRSAYWIYDTYRRTKNTHNHYRFPIPLILELAGGHRSRLDWISESAFRVSSTNCEFKVGDFMECKLWLPAGILEITVRVREIKGDYYEAEFIWAGQEKRDILCDALYSLDWHAEMNEREGYFPTILDKILCLPLGKKKSGIWRWKPGLMRYADHDSFTYVVVGTQSGSRQHEVLGFGRYDEAQEVSVTYPDGSEVFYRLGVVCELQGICELGLDGSQRWRAKLDEISEGNSAVDASA